MCNNPLTKTPKLENAVRIVDEWSELDQEVRSISVPKEKLREMNPIHELIAQSADDTWSAQKSFMHNLLSTENNHTLDEEESPQGGSWFGDLMRDII